MLIEQKSVVNQRAFILPTVLVLCLFLVLVGLSLLSVSSSIQSSLSQTYLDHLASEAADAGITYANYCLETNSNNQTWGPGNSVLDLSATTTCHGSNSPHSLAYVTSTQQNYVTNFDVPDLVSRGSGVYIIVSTGTVKVMGPGGTVLRKYSVTHRQLTNNSTLQPTQTTSGDGKTCATISNKAYCWGENGYNNVNPTAAFDYSTNSFPCQSSGSCDNIGSQGDGTYANHYVPQAVAALTPGLAGKTVTKISAGYEDVCALANGQIWCWGQNSYGQLGIDPSCGNNSCWYSNIPVQINSGDLGNQTVTDISVTFDTVCAIAGAQHHVYCWGRNDSGNTGTGTASLYTFTPTAINMSGAYSAKMLPPQGARFWGNCVVMADNTVYCWGANNYGQLGIGYKDSYEASPKAVVLSNLLPNSTISKIVLDASGTTSPAAHVCIIAKNMGYCWGANSGAAGGSLGTGNQTDKYIPTPIITTTFPPGPHVFTDIVAERTATCELVDGAVYCQGHDDVGQMGIGSFSSSTFPSPTAVAIQSPGLQGLTISGLGGGGARACALSGNSLYCWGQNDDGQLGIGTYGSGTDKPYPVLATLLQPPTTAFIF